MGLRMVAAVFFLVLGWIIFVLLGGTFASFTALIANGVAGGQGAVTALTSSKQELITENELLQRKLDEQTLQLYIGDSLVDWNKTLRAELGRTDEFSKVLAGVVKKPPFTPYDVYTIDAGRDLGVGVGNVALFGDYVALGLVSRVTDSGARVDLFSSPRRQTRVEIDGFQLIAQGQGGGVIRIDVPRDFEAQVGDAVRLPGSNLLIVATIVEVEQTPQDSFKKLIATVPVNIEAVPVVSIVRYTSGDEQQIAELLDSE